MFANEMAQEEVDRDKETDFNKWLLGPTDGAHDEWNDRTNQVLVTNLLQLQRHAGMGVRVCKLRDEMMRVESPKATFQRDVVKRKLRALKTEQQQTEMYI